MNNIIYGLYDDDNMLLKGINFLIKKNISIYEVYTPFPIHGLNEILSFKTKNLSILTFIYGLIGTIIGSLITWYTMNYDWPQNIGGKPELWLLNLPSYIPIIFEITIFCAANFICITYFIFCKIFPGANNTNPDPRTTDDKFMIEIRTNKNIEEYITVLKNSGAIEISVK
ncbi:MAG: DUF3341 domain-containing protein [Candidatus Bostrichicola ureolyticus]|nr:MAG: DUF3341 domain-containing protein [Candidatus Bostrichicola ureolyticus]WGH27237.1 MAG: DUF3341 domain-containing protein [Candidatus Bostrichicola ureolyticus]